MPVYVLNKHGNLFMLCKIQKTRELMTRRKDKALRFQDGTKIHGSTSYRESKIISNSKSYLIERRKGNSSLIYAVA